MGYRWKPNASQRKAFAEKMKDPDERKRIEMIIEYAKKVLQYPKGAKGYDPVDAINLSDAISKYERDEEKRKPRRHW